MSIREYKHAENPAMNYVNHCHMSSTVKSTELPDQRSAVSSYATYAPRLSSSPRVSVLMGVYNGEQFLRPAVESILNQTFADFEFIIVEDGSTDRTWDILREYAAHDRRIVLLRNETNIGHTHSVNTALHLARGEYIARQDADDISLPERLSRQVHYLDTNHHIGILGTFIRSIDEMDAEVCIERLPTTPKCIKWSLFFGNCFAHPSMMMKRTVLEAVGHYAPDKDPAEDYDLWSRISFKFNTANLPEILVHKRVSRSSLSFQRFQIQEQHAVAVMHRAISSYLNQDIPIHTIANVRRIVRNTASEDRKAVFAVATLLRRLHQTYLQREDLSAAEATWISLDAANRLFYLAGQNIRNAVGGSLYAAALAQSITPRLPSYATLGFLTRSFLSYIKIKG